MTRRGIGILVVSLLIGCSRAAGPPDVSSDSENTPAKRAPEPIHDNDVRVIPAPAELARQDLAEAIRRERSLWNPQGCPVIAFRGTVEDVRIAHAQGPGVLTLDFDSRWVVQINVKSAAPENAFIKAGKTAYFNVHSPVRTLGRPGEEAIGKTAGFELVVYEKESDTVWSRAGLWIPSRVVDGRLRSGWEDE
jgi:hypothetical protein